MKIITFNSGVTQPKDKGIMLKDILEDGSNTLYQRGRGNNPGGQRFDKSPCMGSRSWEQNVFVDMVQNGKESYRKLTPIECERLQTINDNFTNHVSNTQRYKALGNGFTVDVIAHILKGIL